MRPPPWWGLLSSAAAPTLLIGGWTLAGIRQPPGYDAVTESISSLAARGAEDRWVMTCALAGVGICHLVSAAALRDAAIPGRLVLGAGGAATVLVALAPLPSGDGGALAHTVAAAVALTSLAAWPAVAAPGPRSASWGLRPQTGAAVATFLLATLGWFVVELATSGSRIGLAERVAAGAQAMWPLAVMVAAVVTTRRLRGGQSVFSRGAGSFPDSSSRTSDSR